MEFSKRSLDFANKVVKDLQEERGLPTDKNFIKVLRRSVTNSKSYQQRLKYRAKFIMRNEEIKKIVEQIDKEMSLEAITSLLEKSDEQKMDYKQL